MSDASQFKLIIQDDEGRRSVVPVELGEVSIGRLDGNTIRLRERNVSRHHARLVREDGNIFAEDLDSFNGVFINGDRMTGRHELRDGDQIRIGDFQLELHGGGLHARREDTTQRTLLGDVDTQPGYEPEKYALEPTITGAKPQHSTEPTQITDSGPFAAQAVDEAHELTSIIRSGSDEEARRAPAYLSGARAKLVCVSTQYAGQEYELAKAETILGRTDDNDIGVDHRSVSRQHAKIVLSGRRYKIVDMRSANGTLVNGEAYAQTELKRGDLIELGHVKFRFVPPGESYTLTAEEQAAVRGKGAGGGHQRIVMWAAGGFTAILLVVAGWLTLGGNNSEKAELAPAVVAPPKGDSGEADRLMTQVHAAVNQHQWKRAQTLANAVLALDPTKDEALTALHQIDMEARAQHSFDGAAASVGQSQWSDAWNALQEVPKESSYYAQALSSMAQVRPALVGERLSDCRAAMKAEDWDEAELQLEEVEGLEPGRKDVTELRQGIEEGRRRKPAPTADKHPSKPSQLHKSKDTPKAVKLPPPPPAPPPPPPPMRPTEDAKALYNDGVKALKAGQMPKAVEDFNRCIVADKNSAPCYRALGIAYAKSGNGPKAARYYRLYLKVDPNARDADQVRQLLQQYESAQ